MCSVINSLWSGILSPMSCTCFDIITDYFVKMKEASGTAALGNKLNKLCLASYNHKGKSILQKLFITGIKNLAVIWLA